MSDFDETTVDSLVWAGSTVTFRQLNAVFCEKHQSNGPWLVPPSLCPTCAYAEGFRLGKEEGMRVREFPV